MVELGARIGRMPLGALLVKAGVASEADVHDALDEGNRKGEKLGQVALRRGWISERKLAKLLADQWGLKAPDPAKLQIDPAASTRLDAGLATELRGLPVAFDEDGLVVAVAEPATDRFEALQALLGDSVRFVVVPSATLEELLDERRATVEKTRTPVELVGAWLGGLTQSSRLGQEAEKRGRDTDEALLDDDNLEEKRSTTTEEPYASEERHDNGKPTVQPALPASPRIDSLLDHLRGLTGAIEGLEHELIETRQRTQAQEAELHELRSLRATDLETISNLGAELEDRRHRLDGLRTALGDLAVALD